MAQTTAFNSYPLGDLETIARKTKTDKHSGVHDYLRLYESVFAPYRDADFTFMELGIGLPRIQAASLKTWRQYFTKAHIVGVDIEPRNAQYADDGIDVEIGDASNADFLTDLFARYAPSVVLDDASHRWSHQITSFKTLFPMLPPGGIYVIEDIFTSFIDHGIMTEKYDFYADHHETAWDFISRLQGALAGAQSLVPALSAEESELVAWIDVILMARKTVVFVKRQAPVERELERARNLAQRQGG